MSEQITKFLFEWGWVKIKRNTWSKRINGFDFFLTSILRKSGLVNKEDLMGHFILSNTNDESIQQLYAFNKSNKHIKTYNFKLTGNDVSFITIPSNLDKFGSSLNMYFSELSSLLASYGVSTSPLGYAPIPQSLAREQGKYSLQNNNTELTTILETIPTNDRPPINVNPNAIGNADNINSFNDLYSFNKSGNMDFYNTDSFDNKNNFSENNTNFPPQNNFNNTDYLQNNNLYNDPKNNYSNNQYNESQNNLYTDSSFQNQNINSSIPTNGYVTNHLSEDTFNTSNNTYHPVDYVYKPDNDILYNNEKSLYEDSSLKNSYTYDNNDNNIFSDNITTSNFNNNYSPQSNNLNSNGNNYSSSIYSDTFDELNPNKVYDTEQIDLSSTDSFEQSDDIKKNRYFKLFLTDIFFSIFFGFCFYFLGITFLMTSVFALYISLFNVVVYSGIYSYSAKSHRQLSFLSIITFVLSFIWYTIINSIFESVVFGNYSGNPISYLINSFKIKEALSLNLQHFVSLFLYSIFSALIVNIVCFVWGIFSNNEYDSD